MDLERIGVLLTFGVYLVLLLVVGWLGERRHSKSYQSFVAADKSLGSWTSALSAASPRGTGSRPETRPSVLEFHVRS